MMNLPGGAQTIIDTLNAAGHSAYVVGGCVRDSLMGLAPKDWDICTSALPEEMQRIFAGFHVVETGLQHGTLTVVIRHEPYEVTTFRVDGEYTDHRHPDGVTFVKDVREDLSRRDFTVNAMAYHPQEGLVDAFSGQEDLRMGVIRCVGDARTRFGEDALRILRALRFAARFRFAIEADTARAIHELKDTLRDVAAERIWAEVSKLLVGPGCGDILRAYADVIGFVMPELCGMFGFDQHTPHHAYDVWEHTVRAVEAAPPVIALRLAMLLHDVGKPACFMLDEQGVGHMYGHAKRSAELAEQAMSRLRMDRATFERVKLLVEKHDLQLSCDRVLLKRRLNQLGEDVLRQLIEIQRADGFGKGTEAPETIEAQADALRAALDALLKENPCVTLRQLAVNGGDLMQAGIPKGKMIGECLNRLLDEVIAERLVNEKNTLLAAALAWQNKG